MPMYHRLGEIPRKRHQVFRKPDGSSIYYEELVGNKGFAGISSLLYHIHPPTGVSAISPLVDLTPVSAQDGGLRHRHFRTQRLDADGSPVTGRIPLLFNDDVVISSAHPTQSDEAYYRNGSADELIYLAEGKGILESQYGDIAVKPGDYVVIPRSVLHRWRLDPATPARLLIVESRSDIRTPKRYRNSHGQLIEGAPFNERDIRIPSQLKTYDEMGDFEMHVKQGGQILSYMLDHHPFDTVGWDGFYYPWAFSIHDFEPLVGRFHQPPPIHQTFEADAFVICSFCPRPYDFDENAVPAPYYHTNAMTDEVLFYASSEFMSRKGIEFASITLHPDGISHGPQPGRMEDSIGVKWTDELAVMIDTFKPLHRTAAAGGIEDADYWKSWL